jgi:hypothetical protein
VPGVSDRLAFGTALLSTLADAALVVTDRRAATMGIEGRAVRRGTARGILAALENILSTTMGSRDKFGGEEGSECVRGMSCREMGQVRELFSLSTLSGNSSPRLGLAPIADAEHWAVGQSS